MPVYNSELYIKEAIDSILNQTFSDFELIIIDDASTDKSVEIIQSYSDSRIHLHVKPQNSGLTKSLNYGISIAKGEYIARMDSDDISLPTRFQKQVEILDHNSNIIVCGTAYQFIGSETVIYNPSKYENIKVGLLRDSCIGHPTVMIRKSVLEVNSILYDENMEMAEDYDLWVRLLQFGELFNFPEILLQYRIHNNQVSNVKYELQMQKATICRINLLSYININFSENEKNVFSKLHFKNKTLSFNELKVALHFKDKISSKNTVSNFFDKEELLIFLKELEHKMIYNYFFNRISYNPKLILHFFQIIFKVNYQLKPKQTFNFFIKSIFGYKIK